MASYKVTSSRVAGQVEGSTVSDADLEGLNVAALVEGGHLTPASAVRESKTKTDKDTEQE